MSLSVSIMAHPSREHFVEELQPQLPGATVVWDRCDDRWDTGSRAMMAYDPKRDWHLVVQDDAILCSAFLPGVEQALAGVPLEHPVSFYTGKTRPYGQFVRKAVASAEEMGAHWIEMRGPLWGVAVAVPTHMIESMVGESNGIDIPNYDMRMAEWFHGKEIKCWYSLPSLVDHRTGDENPSLVPGRSAGEGRTAYEFLTGDPLGVDWNTGASVPGDPSEYWTEDGHCTRCLQKFETVPEAIVHCVEEHHLDTIDFLASNLRHANMVMELREMVPERARGTFYIVGYETSEYVSLPHQKLRRAQAARKLRGGPFTIVGAARDFKFLNDRPGWSVVGGESN